MTSSIYTESSKTLQETRLDQPSEVGKIKVDAYLQKSNL